MFNKAILEVFPQEYMLYLLKSYMHTPTHFQHVKHK